MKVTFRAMHKLARLLCTSLTLRVRLQMFGVFQAEKYIETNRKLKPLCCNKQFTCYFHDCKNVLFLVVFKTEKSEM